MCSEKNVCFKRKKQKNVPKKKNTQNYTMERKKSKGLGCLLSSALFIVVSSTSLNLNVPEIMGLQELPMALFSMSSDVWPACLHETHPQSTASIVVC